MTTHIFALSNRYNINPELVTHRNQDDTVIVMKLDDANIFYKIDGVAAKVWDMFRGPKVAQDVLTAVSTKFPQISKDVISKDFTELMTQFINLKIVDLDSTSTTPSPIVFSHSGDYIFGQIKEFDLAQIESEVLNESIYLDVFAGSDLRLKKDVSNLKNPLERILSLDGISFLWNEKTANPIAPKGVQTGLIAQQVAEMFPELVKKDSATGYLAINYTKLTPYLVESIKDLKSLIDSQNERISNLEKELAKFKH